MSDKRLTRLKEALVAAGVAHGKRNKHVAEATGYTEGSVRGILSGNAALSDRFIKAVCFKFGISLEWVEEGEGPLLARQAEVSYLNQSCDDSNCAFVSMFFKRAERELPKHELIDLAYQIRRLLDGDSDNLATAAADEIIKQIGLVRTSSIKITRITVDT